MVMEVRAAAEGGGASTGGYSTPYGPYGAANGGFGGMVGAISAVAEQAVVVVVEKVGMATVEVGLVVEGQGKGWKTAELPQRGTCSARRMRRMRSRSGLPSWLASSAA